MVQAVLFDYGMVLSAPADPAAWTRMVAIAGVDKERFREAYWAPRHAYDRGTHTGEDYWRVAGRHAGVELTEKQIAELIGEDTAVWTEVNPPMVAWAARLQAAGTPTGILSNLGDAMTAGVLAKLEWLAGFDYKLFSHTVRLAKPEEAIYRIAAEGLGFAPEHILFVDDRADNCAAASAFGMQAVQYGEHEAFVEELERLGLGSLWRTGELAGL